MCGQDFADQLALPEKGAIGFSVNLGEPYLSLELSYENHPGELFFGNGGFASVAAIGILAAMYSGKAPDATIGNRAFWLGVTFAIAGFSASGSRTTSR